jgi:DNA Polymerase alpha zinc finger
VTADQLYNQLQYYQYLFDVDKFKAPAKAIGILSFTLFSSLIVFTEPVRNILSTQELAVFSALHKKAGQYLAKSAIHHVNLGLWFSYYDVIKNTANYTA